MTYMNEATEAVREGDGPTIREQMETTGLTGRLRGTATVAKRDRTAFEGRLDRALSEQVGATQNLHEILSELEARLQPVCHEPDGELGIDTRPQDSGAGVVGTAIEQNTDSVRAATTRIRALLDRLEV